MTTAWQAGADEVEILGLEDERWAALTVPDVGRLKTLLHDDMAYTHTNGMPDSKANYLRSVGDGTLRYSSVDREDVRVRVFGDTAVVTGRARITSALKEGEIRLDARYSAVWVRIQRSWRFVCWHSCPDKMA